MIKKAYQMPTMEEVKLQQLQLLSGSVNEVKTTGLDDDDLGLPDEEQPKSGSVWDDAW